MTDKLVRHLMSTPVVTVASDTPYKTIVQTLDDNRIGAVPVMADGRVLGIVSESDLLSKVSLAGELRPYRVLAAPAHRRARRKAAGDQADAVMSAPAVTIRSDASVVTAARLMDRYRIKHLPVVDNGVLVGIVSRADLLRVFLRTDAAIRDDVIATVLRRVLLVAPTEIRVEVTDGVVTLAGQLDTKSMIAIAVRLTQAVDGVVAVVSRLTYRVDDTQPGCLPGGLARLGRGGRLWA